jgi:CRP-like cAMP-binding protein
MPAAALSNRLLNSLSPENRKSFQEKLVAVPLPLATLIYEPDTVPKYTYFITSGIASVVADLAEGSAVEVGLLGRESVAGSLLLLGGQAVSTRCFMQVGGTGLRISFKELQREFRTNPELHARILQQVQYEALTLSQLSACNRFHEVEGRLARWLLMVSDRIEDNVLNLTQEFLSQMLGTQRTTVSLAAGTLQRAGMILYSRGRVTILHRDLLKDVACDCYANMARFHTDLYVAPVESAAVNS